jgi:hypothetical protein
MLLKAGDVLLYEKLKREGLGHEFWRYIEPGKYSWTTFLKTLRAIKKTDMGYIYPYP